MKNEKRSPRFGGENTEDCYSDDLITDTYIFLKLKKLSKKK